MHSDPVCIWYRFPHSLIPVFNIHKSWAAAIKDKIMILVVLPTCKKASFKTLTLFAFNLLVIHFVAGFHARVFPCKWSIESPIASVILTKCLGLQDENSMCR